MKSKMCRLPAQHVLQRGWSRFWSRVEKRGADECWPWKGAKTSRGYGAFGCGGKQWQAHRFAYAVMNGEFPDFLEVRHMCEARYPVGDFRARLCCNPAHLQTGTHLENMRDKLTSGRIYAGDRHYKRMAAARKAG